MPMKHKPVFIESLKLHENRTKFGKDLWNAASLADRTKDFEVFTIPVRGLCIGGNVWDAVTTPRQMAEHVKRVNNANLDYPIILDEEGFIMDGWHRVTKALVEGVPTIKAVRFDKNPEPDFTEENVA